MTTTRPSGRPRATGAALLCAAVFIACAASPGVAHAGLGGAPMATPPGATVTDLGHGPVAAARAAGQVTGQTNTQPGTQATNAAAGATMQSAAGASSSAATAPYTVRQTTLANGTVVHEYLTSDGNVFGVAWSGPRMPNLSELLGSYFPQYTSTVAANRRSGRLHGPGVVEEQGLVVHSGGHMGAFSGEAWLPQALPAGVAASDIK
jgi:hypothetical protein